MKRFVLTAALAAVVAGPALADITAIANTDLNLRAGPSVGAGVTGVIDSGSTVVVKSCITGSEWCMVTNNGAEGWAAGSYMTYSPDSSDPMTLAPTTERDQIVSPASEDSAAAAAGGATVGALAAAAAAAGPVGIAGAAIAGAALADVADEPAMRTYILANPVDPILLDGEVVVGAGVPETVQLYEVPQTEYRYAYLNGVPVLIQPSDRTIVRVIRQ